jgi:hypothetical protein
MDGYLVMACCTKDDVPVSWHIDRGKAFEAAKALNGVPAYLKRLFPTSTFELAKVVVFQGGKPVKVICLPSTGALRDEMLRNSPPG